MLKIVSASAEIGKPILSLVGRENVRERYIVMVWRLRLWD